MKDESKSNMATEPVEIALHVRTTRSHSAPEPDKGVMKAIIERAFELMIVDRVEKVEVYSGNKVVRRFCDPRVVQQELADRGLHKLVDAVRQDRELSDEVGALLDRSTE